MRVELKNNTLVAIREPGDKRVKDESYLLYRIKCELVKQGHDVVKKLMWKDGHMVANTQQYIRERKGKWAIWDTEYAIKDAAKTYNETGIITFTRENE